ncbi:MAG TPA: hypothetical protein VFH78_15160 [Candidatus Thermoplasmatota archaeon]|nr:hypothetical protein [Candidatus Thermoplasmatota archaeon]
MRAWLLLAVLVASLALPGAAAQQKCRIEYNGQVVEYPCGSGESTAGDGGGDASWFQSLDVWLGIIGLVGSAGAGAYAIYRVRTRRRALTVTLAAIESAYAEAKVDPEAGVAKLAAMRAQVRDEHQKGRLDDIHFLELDRRASQYLVKLRLLEVDRRFPTLPPLFAAEIRRLLSDGVLSQNEADVIEVRAAAYRVPEATRAELIALTRRWAGEDSPSEAAPAAPHVAPRP